MYGSTATEATLAEVMAEGRSFFAWQDRPVEGQQVFRPEVARAVRKMLGMAAGAVKG